MITAHQGHNTLVLDIRGAPVDKVGAAIDTAERDGWVLLTATARFVFLVTK